MKSIHNSSKEVFQKSSSKNKIGQMKDMNLLLTLKMI